MVTSVSFEFDTAVLTPLHPKARKHKVKLAPNLSLRRGTVLAEKRMSPGIFYPYAGPGRADGLSVAKLLLSCDCATDGASQISVLTLTAGQSPVNVKYPDVYAYFTGDFKTEELVGLDDAAVDTLGRLIQGTVEIGILRMD